MDSVRKQLIKIASTFAENVIIEELSVDTVTFVARGEIKTCTNVFKLHGLKLTPEFAGAAQSDTELQNYLISINSEIYYTVDNPDNECFLICIAAKDCEENSDDGELIPEKGE